MFESEERLIVERIKDFIKRKKHSGGDHIMLINGQILDIDNYFNMVSDGKITPQDAYVRIGIRLAPSRVSFRYPFLAWYNDLLDAYLSKLGFYYLHFVVPATGLKYVAVAAIDFYTGRYLSIEVVNLDTAVSNTNLPKIVSEVLGDKLVSGEKGLTRDEDGKIYDMFGSQRLFAGHNFGEADAIIYDYYKGNQSLAKEAARIAIDYYRIFNPYIVCYDMDNWKEVDCFSLI